MCEICVLTGQVNLILLDLDRRGEDPSDEPWVSFSELGSLTSVITCAACCAEEPCWYVSGLLGKCLLGQASKITYLEAESEGNFCSQFHFQSS